MAQADFFALYERTYAEEFYEKIGENSAGANFSYDVTKKAAESLLEISWFRASIRENVPLESCKTTNFT